MEIFSLVALGFSLVAYERVEKLIKTLKKNGFLDKMCIENSYLSVLKKASSG